MKRDRDFQRSKFYAWENELFSASLVQSMTLDECKDLAAQMYGKRVTVKDGRGRRRAVAYTGYKMPAIGLPLFARNAYMVAHEIAHLITKHEGFSGHGGRFVGNYIALLAKFCGEDREELMESAKAFGLRVIA